MLNYNSEFDRFKLSRQTLPTFMITSLELWSFDPFFLSVFDSLSSAKVCLSLSQIWNEMLWDSFMWMFSQWAAGKLEVIWEV